VDLASGKLAARLQTDGPEENTDETGLPRTGSTYPDGTLDRMIGG